MASTAKQRKIRNLLIYPEFQLSLLSFQAFFILMAFFAVVCEEHFAFKKLRGLGIDSNLPKDHAYFRFLNFENNIFSERIVIAFVMVLVISSFVTLLLSFKLAGPIYRLKGYFKEILEDGAGNVKPLSFRRGDFHEDLPFYVNSALEKLIKRHGSQKPKNEKP